MDKALKRIGPGIDAFVQKQLMKHYRDIRLILCDIKFGKDRQKGNRIVKHIREFKDLSPSYWTSMIPVIGMTNYSEFDTVEHEMVAAGADFVFKKRFIFNDLNGSNYKESEKDNNEANTYRTIIDVQVEKFEKNLKTFYPKGLEDEIIRFKDKHKNKKTAFIMTSFQDQHMSIANDIIGILRKFNIKGYIANAPGGMNSDFIWDNIQVFIHGCDFGIGIYADDSILFGVDSENQTKEHVEYSRRIRINPNLSQEVGYMLALQKKVCILKHRNLEKIPSDLAGKIYVEFTAESLEEDLTNWLKNKQIINNP